MFDLLKSGAAEPDKAFEEELRVARARKYLEDAHREYLTKDEFNISQTEFHYIETVNYGVFKRYHFYRGFDKTLIYVVLSDRERKLVIKDFKSKAGRRYVYQDTIITGSNQMQHRFYRANQSNTALVFMDANTGKIWDENGDINF